MVRIFSLAFVAAGTQLPSASAAVTCEKAAQWTSGFDTACQTDCGASACHDFLSVQVDEYIAAIQTCTGDYADYAAYVADPANHEELRMTFLGIATVCGVEVDLELSSCEVGYLIVLGIGANCPKVCGDEEELRPCAEDECERTPDSCAASGEGRCQKYLDKWSNMDDVKTAIDGATCINSEFAVYAGHSDLVVAALSVIEKECSGICMEEGDDDFTC